MIACLVRGCDFFANVRYILLDTLPKFGEGAAGNKQNDVPFGNWTTESPLLYRAVHKLELAAADAPLFAKGGPDVEDLKPIERNDPLGARQAERRRSPRYELALPVTVRIILEEETFSPLRLSGVTKDISVGGMLVEIDPMPETHYRALIRRARMVRVGLHDGGIQTVLLGKVVWYDYQRGADSSRCSVGIAFDNLAEASRRFLQDLIERKARQPQP